MFTQRNLIIFLILLALLGGGYWLTIRLLGGWTAIALQPPFAFDSSQASAAPDYRLPSAWGAYPNQKSFANERPPGEEGASPSRRAAVDVFYIHPTTLLSNEHWTSDPKRDDSTLNFGSLRTQAGVFNKCCQIYAPHYRQATLWSFIGEEPSAYKALEFAYADVRRAFRHFVKRTGNRPFILAAHSQGSLHALRLLTEEIAPNKRLSTRMVVAYPIGYTIPKDIGSSIKPCKDARSTGCYVSWNSVVEHYEGDFWRTTGRLWFEGRWQTMAGKSLTCVNPLSWRLDGGLVSKRFHKGGLKVKTLAQKDLPGLTPNLVSARCSADGLLYISDPEADYESSMIDNGDYHTYNYHLFYEPLRLNVEERIKSFFKKSSRD